MSYKKSELLYEGKGKRVFAIEADKNLLWLEFKDSLTAFNAQKKGSFENKGAINRDIASIVFRYLNKFNIRSHWVQDMGATDMVCEKLVMMPIEVVVRNTVAGSLAKKFGLEEGAEIQKPLVEFYFKRDELNDPFMSDEQAIFIGAAKNQAELDELKKQALQINIHMKDFFTKIGLRLVDFKLEFGRDSNARIKLGDEISPDSCRLWDIKTNEKLDKDRFRRDLGGVAEGYQEVLKRIEQFWGKEV